MPGAHIAGITRHMVKDFPDRTAAHQAHPLDPERIIIEYNEITGDTNYWMDIDPHTQSRIKDDKFYLATTPWSFIQAIHRGQRYKFNKDYFFHMKRHIAGIQLKAGLPSILSSFKNFFRLQILLRYDETLMMDYIVPNADHFAGSPDDGAGRKLHDADRRRWPVSAGFQEGVVRHHLDGADCSSRSP